MWLKHPKTGDKDTMLTIGVAGFVFCIFFTAAALVASWVLQDSNFMKYVAMIDAAIMTPTIAAYTARKYTDSKKKQ